MAHQHTHQNSQDQDALRAMVLSLTIDVRLTPLDRNCWHVMCAFHAIRPLSPPASGHLFHAHPAGQSERSDAGLHC